MRIIFNRMLRGKRINHKQYIRNPSTGDFYEVKGKGGMNPTPKTLPKTGPNTEDSPKSRERRSALPDQPAPRTRANQVPVSPVEGAPVSKVSNKLKLDLDIELSEKDRKQEEKARKQAKKYREKKAKKARKEAKKDRKEAEELKKHRDREEKYRKKAERSGGKPTFSLRSSDKKS